MGEFDILEMLTREAIDQDCWNAVLLPLPENPDPILLKEVHGVAEYCYEAAKDRLENSEGYLLHAFDADPRRFPQFIQPGGSSEFAKMALQRLEELERLDPDLLRVGPHSEYYAQQMRQEEERLAANSAEV